MKRIGSFIEARVNKLSLVTSSVLIFLMLWVVMCEVITRYFFHFTVLADEISAYILVAAIFLGLAYTLKEEGHIRLLLLISRLPAKASNWLRVITLSIIFAYVAILTEKSCELVVYSYTHAYFSVSMLRAPLYLPQLALPLGCALLGIQLLFEIGRAIRSLHTGRA